MRFFDHRHEPRHNASHQASWVFPPLLCCLPLSICHSNHTSANPADSQRRWAVTRARFGGEGRLSKKRLFRKEGPSRDFEQPVLLNPKPFPTSKTLRALRIRLSLLSLLVFLRSFVSPYLSQKVIHLSILSKFTQRRQKPPATCMCIRAAEPPMCLLFPVSPLFFGYSQ